ncbi:2-amino-4-hydroxy-6-hydroxymethyldihydropteridine diphosphokinase [Entomomonas moraniae]|uniref:2-amino-4-hydroxy-6-hydroxymethyldihydropteridine pyrophosphokinase n=1 Tax=Entomomonas moraniae TaxID=2213226 RepID=A0A3S9XG92_9GAMM|nr:2-amino-4-hydroxy-6-hydroxymethyldihydropteridine diphosphokinase [Entomomonas moraniae]AZS51370.1 2-amino-4-hydroxy-6-hydroxymethyldihydropteridine diphosphokinase [Entomomonas moraniae]
MTREIVYIGLGSNLENPVEQVKEALRELAYLPESTLVKQSSIYCSDSLLDGQPQYINAVACLETALTPECLLDHLQRIENSHGRERKEKWGARTLDLDIILYGKKQINTDRLTVPHSQLALRSFVLIPLAEIAPRLSIPRYGAMASLLEDCPSQNLHKYL